MQFEITNITLKELHDEDTTRMNEMADAGYSLVCAVVIPDGVKLVWSKKK